MKQTAWIDSEGYWLRDEPTDDSYTPKSDRQIDLKKYPIPSGLNYPRFVASTWQEGSTTKPYPTTPSRLPVAPNWGLLKTGMQPFYQKYAGTLNLTANVAFYMSAINSETNSLLPSTDILRTNMTEWVKALSIRLDSKDKTQINQLLTQCGFDFQI